MRSTGFLDEVADILVSFLPPDWRPFNQRGRALLRANTISCYILVVTSFAMMLLSYFHLVWYRATGPGEVVGGPGSIPLGIIAEFLLQPVNWLLIYFVLDSTVRLVAATTGEDLPLLVLAAIAFLVKQARRRMALRELGPLVEDAVFGGDGKQYDLRILSCRPKDWGPLVALSYQNQLYQLAAMDIGEPPRRFIYYLRKMPMGAVARGLRPYDPRDVLIPPEHSARPETLTNN